MVAKNDLSGQRFERVVVVSSFESTAQGKARWNVRCDCGTEFITRGETLTRGKTRSCGCLQREELGNSRRTHGKSGSKEYHAFTDAQRRSYETGGFHFATFEAFLAEVGPAPSPMFTIDRIDPFKGYEPGNVRWATRKTQNRNKRKHVYVVYEGERMLLSEACERAGVNYHVAYGRLKRGKEPFDAEGRKGRGA